jgi:NhaP-type Na+/H+ or K+/H+ antiporter
MEIGSIAVIAAGLLAFSLVSGRLRDSVLAPPLVFIVFGFVISRSGLGMADISPGHSAIHLVAELTLILVLFADAARIDLRHVRRDHNLPLRMLTIGLPLTILFGGTLASLMFPAFSVWEAALPAARADHILAVWRRAAARCAAAG